MNGKAGLIVGLAAGYVLGSRAGRERYNQIKEQALKVWNTDRVQEQVGKVKDFATGYGEISVPPLRQRWSQEEEAAIAFATSPQMGLRRADAERLLQRAKSDNPALSTAELLLPEMLRLYTARS